MFAFARLLSTLFASAAVANALSSVLVPITDDFGPNPTNVSMHIYKPARLVHPTPLIMAIHYCSGSAQKYFWPGTLARLADEHGLILIYPTAPAANGCWDVNTDATLTHNGGGDSLAIASVVRWAIKTQGVDPTRVFSAGTSSGAMMTNVLMGAYPDLFRAGVAFSGVPYGCFAGPDPWHSDCAEGRHILSPQEWGDRVRSGFPGYTGPRPKLQIWHGTADYVLRVPNFWEGIKQWTHIFGVSEEPIWNVTGPPLGKQYSRASYGPNFQAILGQGVGHSVPEHWNEAIEWFGLGDLIPKSQSACPHHCYEVNSAREPPSSSVHPGFMDEL